MSNDPIQTTTRISLTRVTDTDPDADGSFELRIEDAASRQILGKHQIGAREFANLMSNRSAEATAKLFPGHADRWGKQMEIHSMTVGRDELDGLDSADWAEQYRVTNDWDTVDVRPYGSAYTITVRRWR